VQYKVCQQEQTNLEVSDKLNNLPTDCLTKNSYQEDKCRAEVDALYECCNRFYHEKGDDAKTLSCPKATLLRLKMEQRARGL
jgi:hypothetical protein